MKFVAFNWVNRKQHKHPKNIFGVFEIWSILLLTEDDSALKLA